MAYFDYETLVPIDKFKPYVECYWRLHNVNNEDKAAIILPDGRIDLIFSKSDSDPFHASLIGVSTKPEKVVLEKGIELFGVSLKLPAAEYILRQSISGLNNSALNMSANLFGIRSSAMVSFEVYCQKINSFVMSRIPESPDQRKLILFDYIYTTRGSLTISEYSDKVKWSSRQINRYFNRQFGISLKAYCEVLRFRAGLGHITYGKLYPQENYTDQSHFIKEVRKHSGVSPKKLYKNDQDQFIQLLVSPIS